MNFKHKIKDQIRLLIKKIGSNLFNISELNFLIPGEIKFDQFSELIKNLSSLSSVKKIIEIGSSSGDGSTKSFIEALSKRKDLEEITFICLELSNVRFKKLQNYLTPYKFTTAYNLSSVDISSFQSEEQVRKFYISRETNLNKNSLSTVLSWRKQDIEFIKSSGRNICGIEAIKRSQGFDSFDLCLIDGSEFTGKAELDYLLGTKYILLDDTESLKCKEAFEILNTRNDYELIEYQPNCRNGFAAFKKK